MRKEETKAELQVILTVKGHKIELNAEEAKKLLNALKEVFPEPKKEYVPYYKPWPYYEHTPIWYNTIAYNSAKIDIPPDKSTVTCVTDPAVTNMTYKIDI